MVSRLLPAADIVMTASSVAAAVFVFLGTVIPRAETKSVPTTTLAATMNEMRHGVPSTQPSDLRPREGKGKLGALYPP